MMATTALGDKMRALADTGHDNAEELRDRAEKFDTATAGYYSDPQTVDVKSFMGHYARARILWCKCSGESLA